MAKGVPIRTHLQAIGTTTPLDVRPAFLSGREATATTHTKCVAIFGTMPPRWTTAIAVRAYPSDQVHTANHT
ncbi:MAG: hypothetical protein ABI557_20145 [Aureliella sp.]